MNIKNSLLISCLSISSAYAHDIVYRPKAEILYQKQFELSVSATQFETLARYDVDGNEVSYDNEDDGFIKRDIDTNLYYSFNDSFEFNLGGRYRTYEDTVSGEAQTVSGGESYWLGVKYPFSPVGNMRYALNARFRKTMYTNTDYATSGAVDSEDKILGDSGSEFQLGMYASWLRSQTHAFDAYLAYNAPPNGLSPEVVYDLSTSFHYSRFGIDLGVKGIESLGADSEEERPFQSTPSSSGLFNSVNRAHTAGYIRGAMAFGNFKVGGEFANVFRGVSTDQGASLGIHLTYQSKGNSSSSQKKINKFKEYTIEATVLKVSARGKFVKIDHGLAQDVEKGMKFDIYKTDYFGGNVLVASGHIVELGANWSIIRLQKLYKKMPILKGFVARASN